MNSVLYLGVSAVLPTTRLMKPSHFCLIIINVPYCCVVLPQDNFIPIASIWEDFFIIFGEKEHWYPVYIELAEDPHQKHILPIPVEKLESDAPIVSVNVDWNDPVMYGDLDPENQEDAPDGTDVILPNVFVSKGNRCIVLCEQ